jgi:hypothetical protein
MNTNPRAKRPRPEAPLQFEKPKVSTADIHDRLVRAVGIEDPDFLSSFINQVIAVGELGKPSDDHESCFSLSAIEGILSHQSNGVAKAMLAAQYTAMHAVIMRLARQFTRMTDFECQDLTGRLLSSLARTSVAQYEALNRLNAGVNVGHLSINDGSQAIVGNVTQNQHQQNSTQQQPLLEDAKSIPMTIMEEPKERDAVVVSVQKKPRG